MENCRRTRRALADVDAGCVLEHEIVRVWAGSFGVNPTLDISF